MNKNNHTEKNTATKINILIHILQMRKHRQSGDVICPHSNSWCNGRAESQCISLYYIMLYLRKDPPQVKW